MNGLGLTQPWLEKSGPVMPTYVPLTALRHSTHYPRGILAPSAQHPVYDQHRSKDAFVLTLADDSAASVTDCA